jgi:two-component system phosphate regulon response regulator PhoB
MAPVLVVDDDEDLRMLCELHLQIGGFNATSASNGREAIDAARRQRPALILLDLMMPIMDGWECLAALKSDPELRSVPVFIVTGKSQQSDQDRAFAMGAEAFIPKPFKGPQLVEMIRQRVQAGARG